MQIGSSTTRLSEWGSASAATLHSPEFPIHRAVVRRSVLSLYAVLFTYLFSGQALDVRDPLGTSLDWHIYAQLALFALAFVCGIIIWVRSETALAWHLPSQLFLAFGLMAVLSSWRSFWPPLSLVKGCLFVCVLILAEMLCAAYSAKEVLRISYYSVLLLLGVALLLGVLLPNIYPLTVVDVVGRHRLELFTDEHADFAYLTGMTVLLGRLPCIRARWYFQLALIVLTVVSGNRACTFALLAILGILQILRFKDFRVTAAACMGCIVFVGGLLLVAGGDTAIAHGVQDHLVGFYGDTAAHQSPFELSGRVELWQATGSILSQCIVIGQGFDGARDQLMRVLPWAGAAHNEFLELMLSAGAAAASAFVYGWFIVVRRGLRPGIVQAALPIHIFLFLVSFTGQSLTMYRAFGTLLLVCLQYWTVEGGFA